MTAVGLDREQPYLLFKQNAHHAICLVSFDGKYRAYIQKGAINPKVRTRKSGRIEYTSSFIISETRIT